MLFRIPESHPVSVLHNKRTRVVVITAFGLGFLMGYVSFIVGVIGAVNGMRSLIQMLCYRRKYLRLLKRHSMLSKKKSAMVQATVVSRKRAVDPITNHRRYKVVLDYRLDEQANPNQLTIRSTDLPFASKSVYHDAPREGGIMDLHIIQGKPIPTMLYQDKIQDLQIWAKYVDPIISFIGLYFYLFFAWLYSQLFSTTVEGSATMLIMSLLSLLLMAPYLVLETRSRHEHRMDQLRNNPIELVTEFDKLRNIWQSPCLSLTQKSYPLFFGIGLLLTMEFSNAGAIPGCWAVWTLAKWTDLRIARQRESLMESFRQAKKVDGFLIDCYISGFWSHGSSSVTVEYVAPSGETIQKKLANERLLQKYLNKKQHKDDDNSTSLESATTDILVLSGHPSSGYPEPEIAESWSLCKDQTVSVVSCLLYLLWFLIQYDDWLPFYLETNFFWLDELVNDIILFWAPAFLGILLMMPQAYAFHRVRYRKLLADVFESGSATSCLLRT
eukprot:scaffold1323_cov113-Cylindrotheca_fusiformis.AAC.15